MNRNTLTLLGCSSSLALVLAIGNAANAETVEPKTLQYGNFVEVEATAPQTATPPAPAQSAELDPNSDTVGDLAIAKFRCDCPACRVAIVQMVQAGQLSL
jgi:hypothetical protein